MKKVHQQGFYGVIVMMRISDFLKTVVGGKAVNGAAAEKGASKARVLALVFLDDGGNIHLHKMKGHVQFSAKSG